MISIEAFTDEIIKIATNAGIARACRGAPKSRSGSRPIRVSTLLKKESGALGATARALQMHTPGFWSGAALTGSGIYGAKALKKKLHKFQKERAIISQLREQGYFDDGNSR